MVGWHHQINQHEFEQALGVGDGQGSPTTQVKEREEREEREN